MTVRPFEADSLSERLCQHAAGSYLICKHSPYCGFSPLAAQEVAQLAQDCPELEVFEIDVIRQRETSRAVAELLGVRQQSPQVILVAEGRAACHASGGGVRARSFGYEDQIAWLRALILIGEIEDRLGRPDDAIASDRRFLLQWEGPDPGLPHLVRVRSRLNALLARRDR
ncbi:MAG: monothiol bacilliredoxin BrxC family protein [Gemmatimonadales bacterium]